QSYRLWAGSLAQTPLCRIVIWHHTQTSSDQSKPPRSATRARYVSALSTNLFEQTNSRLQWRHLCLRSRRILRAIMLRPFSPIPLRLVSAHERHGAPTWRLRRRLLRPSISSWQPCDACALGARRRYLTPRYTLGAARASFVVARREILNTCRMRNSVASGRY